MLLSELLSCTVVPRTCMREMRLTCPEDGVQPGSTEVDAPSPARCRRCRVVLHLGEHGRFSNKHQHVSHLQRCSAAHRLLAPRSECGLAAGLQGGPYCGVPPAPVPAWTCPGPPCTARPDPHSVLCLALFHGASGLSPVAVEVRMCAAELLLCWRSVAGARLHTHSQHAPAVLPRVIGTCLMEPRAH